MKKVLIIGGAGFIGSSLANKLSKNFIVYILDVKKNPKINYLEKKIHFIYGDISISDTFKKIS